MVIENDARRFIIDSINIESVLCQPHMQQVLMKKEFNENRSNLLQKICSVNSVANEDGKGRDDFKFEILMSAEELVGTKATQTFRGFSLAVQNLANKVIDSYDAYRKLMHTYESNIEVVDPQLRNNKALVEVLQKFEDSWTSAQNQILNKENLAQLNNFSWLLVDTGKRFAEFKEQIECRDASIFMSIPSLLVYEALLSAMKD